MPIGDVPRSVTLLGLPLLRLGSTLSTTGSFAHQALAGAVGRDAGQALDDRRLAFARDAAVDLGAGAAAQDEQVVGLARRDQRRADALVHHQHRVDEHDQRHAAGGEQRRHAPHPQVARDVGQRDGLHGRPPFAAARRIRASLPPGGGRGRCRDALAEMGGVTPADGQAADVRRSADMPQPVDDGRSCATPATPRRPRRRPGFAASCSAIVSGETTNTGNSVPTALANAAATGSVTSRPRMPPPRRDDQALAEQQLDDEAPAGKPRAP